MKKTQSIEFVKMVAAGNDFVVIDQRLKRPLQGLRSLARKICDRRYGVGADGMLIVENTRRADLGMRVFNADGSEAEMCGNGARCVAYYGKLKVKCKKERVENEKVTIETRAGIITALVSADTIKIQLGEPKDLKFGIPLIVHSRPLNVDFINTGVPHAVIFVHDLENLDVDIIAVRIRNHKRFAPRGANVNFVEVTGTSEIKIRTYERGVEAETPACGTGSVAAALIFALKSGCRPPVKVHTRSREVLKVYWERGRDRLSQVWLEGAARIVYKGEYSHV